MNYRQDFPFLNTYPQLAYLDNAATTQKPQAVITAINDYYCKTNANVHRGIYKLSEAATIAYENSREVVADFISAEPTEIIFTSGTTASINLLAQYYFAKRVKSDEVILLSVQEHHSNILPWQQLANTNGNQLKYIPLTTELELNLTALTEILKTEKIAVLSLNHISNVLGSINPINEIVKITRKYSPKTKIVIDAAQSLVHQPIDVKAMDCDFLVASAHKAYGPTGIGFIYAKQELLADAEPFFTGGGMIAEVNEQFSTYTTGVEKFEAGTPNIAGAIGFAAAIKYITQIGWDNIMQHEKELTEKLMQGLKEISALTVYGTNNIANKSGVFSFNLAQVHPHDLAQILDQDEVAIRAGHHCAQILHKKILNVPASCRASLAIYNTAEDIDQLISALKAISITGLSR